MTTMISTKFMQHHCNPKHREYYNEWCKWRDTYEGGDYFIDKYLEPMGTREDHDDFCIRKKLTRTQAFVTSAVNAVRDAIFQRLVDVSRVDGSMKYQAAVAGESLGVDLCGSSMNNFIGQEILAELMVMGQYGVFVDMPDTVGETLADNVLSRPYIYGFRREQILNWRRGNPGDESEFTSIMLLESGEKFDDQYGLPTEVVHRIRVLWLDEDGFVRARILDKDGANIDRDGNELPDDAYTQLSIRRIPFVLFDIGSSLIKNAVNHQITLMNLSSTNVNYLARNNFPLYVEQDSGMGMGDHLKKPTTGSSMDGGQPAGDGHIQVGPTRGRTYVGDTPPGYIAPPTEPIEVGMLYEEKLEVEIYAQINSSLKSLAAKQQSGKPDSDSLEAGLSFIGSVLEKGERQLARYWADYENTKPAVVAYPRRWTLLSESDRIEDAGNLFKLLFSIPGTTSKREVAKLIANKLFAGRVSNVVLQRILLEIDASDCPTSDPQILSLFRELGAIPDITLVTALGLPGHLAAQAADDHAARLTRIAIAQSIGGGEAATQGVADTQANPGLGGREAKTIEQDADTNPDTSGRRTRRRGRRPNRRK